MSSKGGGNPSSSIVLLRMPNMNPNQMIAIHTYIRMPNMNPNQMIAIHTYIYQPFAYLIERFD